MTPDISLCQVAARMPSLATCFKERVRSDPTSIAVEQGSRRLTYGALNERVNRLANGLKALGVDAGARVALLSENRIEYLELKLAAARIGAAVACQNWRQAAPELAYCFQLAAPALVVASQRYAAAAQAAASDSVTQLVMGDAYESLVSRSSAHDIDFEPDPEAPFTLLYTSGTTGRPKAAIISQRAVVARALATAIDRPMGADEAFVAWTPLFHMGSSDHAMAAFIRGAKVIVVDGFDVPAIAQIVRTERLGWLHVMPGTVDRLVGALAAGSFKPRGITYIGVMADLVPRHRLGELTRLLGAPYANTFGSTEAGGILSRSNVQIGEVPDRLVKRLSALCTVRLVQDDGQDVQDGEAGELWVRSPCLFSGYWRDEEQTQEVFRDGWFHTGDVFVRHADSSYEFVDRKKYLIKSGGENIYPAEIERILMANPDVAEAVVVRRKDAQWGEVPVAFVVSNREGLTQAEVLAMCDGTLARYKRPREVRFVPASAVPRSTSGKVIRTSLEEMAATVACTNP